jgi:hypothetical protein
VKVAVDLARVSALSLLFETRRHPLDLTISVSTPIAGRSYRPRRPSSELIETSSTPPRAPSPLHAHPRATHHLLRPSTTDPDTVDCQSTHGERRPRQTLARDAGLACMHNPHEEEGSRAIRSELDGGVPLRCRQARAGHWIWAGLA